MFDESVTPESQQEEQVTDPQAPESGQEQSDDWLVIGDRKYDKRDAETKIVHADNHIKTLEQELADLRSKLDQAETERKREMVRENIEQPVKETSTAEQKTPESSTDDLESKLSEMVGKFFTQKEQETVKQQNLTASVAKAQSKYGSAYQQKLLEIGKGLGMEKEEIAELASTKPQVFERLFDLQGVKPAPSQRVPESNSVAPRPQDADPFKQAAATVLTSKSSRERNQAIADLLSQAKR